MKKMILSTLTAASVLFAPLAIALDTTEGTVLAFDRKANTLVLSDKTVWPLEQLTSALPTNLKAGDRVEIQYESDEDGLAKISSIALLSNKMPVATTASAQDTTDGTILALDRKAKTLVLTDKTVWPLQELTAPIPADLKAGDRVAIQYESDEDGVTTISSVRRLSN